MVTSILHLDASIQAPALNGEREGARPSSNLLLELVDLGNLAAGNLGLEVLESVGTLGQRSLSLNADLDGLVNVQGDALKVLLSEATAGHGRGTNTDTTRSQSALVSGNSVLVAGNVDLLKDSLNTGAIKVELTKVEEDHVAVSAISNELVAELLELDLQGLGVGDNLLLVGLELRGLSLLEGNSQSSDGVVVRTTLVAREDGEVDRLLKVVEGLLASLGVNRADTLSEEDHGSSRTTEGLVSGGGDDISPLEGRRNGLSSDKTRDVSHINNQVGADGISNLAHALVVDQTAVSGGTGNEDLGAVQDSVLLELVVVDDTSLEVDTVGHGLEVGRDSGDPNGRLLVKEPSPSYAVQSFVYSLLSLGGLVAVAQVATVGQVETHETAVGRHDSLVDLQVGRAAAEALDVDTPLLVVEVEGIESTALAEQLDLVNVLVATIVTSTGVALRVLVGHGRAQGIEDGAGGDVLGGNENNGLALTLNLIFLQAVC